MNTKGDRSEQVPLQWFPISNVIEMSYNWVVRSNHKHVYLLAITLNAFIYAQACLLSMYSIDLYFIVQSIAVIRPTPFMYITSIHSSIFLCLSRISFGSSIQSSRTSFGFLQVLFPLRVAISGPNIFCAMLISSILIGQFCTPPIFTNPL